MGTDMRIAILANGTRGDIQPKLALGEELQRRGHSVVITVNENLATWARRSNVQIVTLPRDSEALLKSDEGIALLAKGESREPESPDGAARCSREPRDARCVRRGGAQCRSDLVVRTHDVSRRHDG
jgi:hypothetical protein